LLKNKINDEQHLIHLLFKDLIKKQKIVFLVKKNDIVDFARLY